MVLSGSGINAKDNKSSWEKFCSDWFSCELFLTHLIAFLLMPCYESPQLRPLSFYVRSVSACLCT